MFRMIAHSALAVCTLVTGLTYGQTTYRVRDLGPIGSASPLEEDFALAEASLPFRINNKHQIVYYVWTGSAYRAKLYVLLKDEDIDLNTGIYDLSTLDGSNAASFALDLNEDTQIAGARGAPGTEIAVVWTFDSEGDITAHVIDFSESDFNGSYSRAHGISISDPPVKTRRFLRR